MVKSKERCVYEEKYELFVVIIVMLMTSYIPIMNAKAQSDVYELELQRWGVYNVIPTLKKQQMGLTQL